MQGEADGRWAFLLFYQRNAVGLELYGRSRWCSCCQKKRATTGRVATGAGRLVTGLARVDMCDDCARAKHEISQCLLCGVDANVWVFQCAQLHHLADRHPGVIERRTRAPEDAPVTINDNLKLLGSIDLDALERIHKAED